MNSAPPASAQNSKSLPIAHFGESRANPIRRLAAKAIDGFIVMFASAVIWYPVGPLLGLLYSLFADALPRKGFEGQSLGKKWLGIQVISTKFDLSGERKKVTYLTSLYRNAPIGLATFLALIPFWGWAVLALIGFPLMVIEIYLIVRAPRGQRLGDVIGDTEVVELQLGRAG
ncbi:MAG: RDD family protein [Cryobacterium sp.]|nr:RDD family protein [Oligoflexia bacterium]